jgi:tetratricopeptide (TPR) repeat protein
MSRAVLRLSLRSAASALALAAALSLAVPGRALAASGSAAATEMNGYGRVVFTFDRPVKATMRATSGVVILAFDNPLQIDISKIAPQLPGYLSVVRIDPDNKTIRFATSRTLRTNVIEAGEKVFVDFLPESWQGLPPALPQDVVENLAKRARAAEEELRKTQRERDKREVRDVQVRVGHGPTFTRLIFDVGQTVPVDIKRDGDQLTIVFDAALRMNALGIRAQLPETVQALDAETSGGQLKVTVGMVHKAEMRAFREDDTVIVDFPKPRPANVPAAEAEIALPKAQPDRGNPASPEPSRTEMPARIPAPPPVRASSDVSGTLRPQLRKVGAGVVVTVPFRQMPAQTPPAAVFMRHDVLWMVFDTRDVVEAVTVPADLTGAIARVDVDRAAGASILRVTLRSPQPVRVLPNAAGWNAVIGEGVTADGLSGEPSEPVLLRRGVADNGRTILKARMPALGQVFWMDDPDTGDRMGVVTAQGPAHGLAKGQGFVELQAHPTIHGIVISPRSDDVQVQAGLDEVTVTRDTGLTVSLGVSDAASGAREGQKELLLDAESWRAAQLGDIRERGNALLRAAADAPKSERTEARFRLAKFKLATGDVAEAVGIMQVLEQDDPTAASTKPILLTRGMAAVMMRDGKEAMRFLADGAIQLEAEAGLWRAALDAENGRWTPALVGFRTGLEELARYPDDLQARMRRLAAIAGIEGKDGAFAAQQIDLLERLTGRDGDPAAISLLRGRLALLQNRAPDALPFFEAAMKSRHRGTEAEARLEHALLSLRDPKAAKDKIVAELETVAMIWRRGETEVRALSQLGEMYAADGRWRQAFAAARRANEILPEHELSRALHDTMAKRFEELFLDGKADELPKVEAVGLFYDFRSLMPISRRGDEIVRRLADRLVDLDLLDQASDLLGHQVNNRLGGLQRARVAARLAVIHLMNRKPAEAVQVLRSSRLNDLPDDVRRARLLLEARALSELSRTDLAIEVLAGQAGADAERLRADVLWRGKRWGDAGEAIERVLGSAWQGAEELSDSQRADVMRAGVAYVLADDRMAIDRLRQKFMPKMADSIDARPFALVTGDSRVRGREFRDIARSVVADDTLAEFLKVYRQRYPDIAGAPRDPKAAEDAVRQMRERSQQQGDAAPRAPQPG